MFGEDARDEVSGENGCETQSREEVEQNCKEGCEVCLQVC